MSCALPGTFVRIGPADQNWALIVSLAGLAVGLADAVAGVATVYVSQVFAKCENGKGRLDTIERQISTFGIR